MESFLPKIAGNNQDTSDVTTLTGFRAFERPHRVEVVYNIIYKDPTKFKTFGAVFVFGPDTSIQEARDHAVSFFPEREPTPDFTDIFVFFNRRQLLNRGVFFLLTDLSANVHDMFGPDTEMIISNDQQYYQKVQSHEVGKIVTFLKYFGSVVALFIFAVVLFNYI